MGLFELASATMRNGERRVELAAQNVANIETPGYKSQVAFSDFAEQVERQEHAPMAPSVETARPHIQGVIVETGLNLDFAIDGEGALLVRDGDDYVFTRNGKFEIASDGRISDSQGRVLQLSSGGDAIASSSDLEVLPDGTILENDRTIGTLGVFKMPVGATDVPLAQEGIADIELAAGSEIRQAMLENSTVVLSDQMVQLMRAQRQVEGGAQLIRAYDSLLDRAINAFGRSN